MRRLLRVSHVINGVSSTAELDEILAGKQMPLFLCTFDKETWIMCELPPRKQLMILPKDA